MIYGKKKKKSVTVMYDTLVELLNLPRIHGVQKPV